MLSLIFILTIKPENISIARPKDEIIKIGLNFSPTINPEAPKNCEAIMIGPSFSKPNRLNSPFILGNLK